MSAASIIDTNVHLGCWPFRKLAGDDPAEMVARLRSHGVASAWAGAFEGVFHRDLAAVNERLAEACATQGDGLLVPFGSANVSLPAWERDLAACRETWNMPGVRLHPGYHGYSLDDPRFESLCDQAAERGLIVQIAVCLEDERTQSALARAPHVDVAPLVAIVRRLPALRVQLLNAFGAVSASLAVELAAAGRAYMDIAMLEGLAGIERLLRTLPVDRLLFGSHAPFFYFESALLKLRESRLDGEQTRAILHANAGKLLADTNG